MPIKNVQLTEATWDAAADSFTFSYNWSGVGAINNPGQARWDVSYSDADGNLLGSFTVQSANLTSVNGTGTITLSGDAVPNIPPGGSFGINPAPKPWLTDGPPVPVKVTDAVTTETVVCFMPGTLIATPSGEVAVEALAAGDLVLTADGRAVSVVWMGRQRVVNHAFGVAERRAPVCIAAGALGAGLPHTDLRVSADHGMVWEGLVVHAGAMVNGTTIRFVPQSELPAEYTFYHIETEGHEVVLANGAPTETFVDNVTRGHFDNYQEYQDLIGAERVVLEMPRPRISSQRMLPDALRAKLGIAPFGQELGSERDALLQRLAISTAA